MRFPGGSAFLELLSRDFSKKSQYTLNRGHRLAPRAWHVVTSKHEKADTKGKKRKKQQLTEWKQGEQHLSVVREKPLRRAIVWCTETHELWISAELLLNSLHQHQARELHHMTSNTHMRTLWPLQSSKHTRQSAVECCVCWVNHYAVLHLAAFREQRGSW